MVTLPWDGLKLSRGEPAITDPHRGVELLGPIEQPSPS